MTVALSTCAHLVLPGTSKTIAHGFISKRTRSRVKISNDDVVFRNKR